MASGALVAGTALTAVALGAGAAQAADLDQDFDYSCDTTAAGLPLGPQAVGVNATVAVPDEVLPGDVIPPRKTQITLTLPETLRNATYSLLGAREAGGSSDDASISITADGHAGADVYPIANLEAPFSAVPAGVGDVWTIPTEGDVPEIIVPTDAATGGTATIHMPAAFNVTASLKNATGDYVGGVGAVSMACSLVSTDDTFGTIPIGHGDPPPDNESPAAADVTAGTYQNAPVEIALEGSDPDDDPLTYTYDQPEHGTVSGEGPGVTYAPASGYTGVDTFAYTVSDGQAHATGTVTVTVAQTPNEGEIHRCDIIAAGLSLGEHDVPISYQVELPESASPGETIPASDASVTVTLPPTLSPQVVSGLGTRLNLRFDDTSAAVLTRGVDDVESALLTTTAPAVLDLPLPNPAAGTFTIAASLGAFTLPGPDTPGLEIPGGAVLMEPGGLVVRGASDAGDDLLVMECGPTVADTPLGSVDILSPNTPPTAGDVSASTDEDTAVDIALDGADADADELTYSYGAAGNGTVEGEGANVTYTPAAGFFGEDTFTYTVSDGEAEATGTVTVTVNEVVVDPPGDRCGPRPEPGASVWSWLKWITCKLLGGLGR